MMPPLRKPLILYFVAEPSLSTKLPEGTVRFRAPDLKHPFKTAMEVDVHFDDRYRLDVSPPAEDLVYFFRKWKPMMDSPRELDRPWISTVEANKRAPKTDNNSTLFERSNCESS